MAIEAPPALPDGKPDNYVQRLRKICCDKMQISADPAARQKFAILLTCLGNEVTELPVQPLVALAGKADHPTCTGVLYAKVLQAIALHRGRDFKALAVAVTDAERLQARDYRIVGDRGIGWKADFEDKK